MRKYEILYILKPTLNEKEIDEINKNISNIFENEGKILEYSKPELRTLARPIKKFSQGFYSGFLVEANNDMVKEFNRVINITEEIIRHVIYGRD
ncbi:MAG: 30S ribosomal protein S6 [Phytoplasma sp.]|uniref:30S ribosomal protein S6 n=1 Tax=Phytoplasma sp. TaxID=2155 RepID=UPI002B40AB17|nr:30S ribosomal protein S6 [Phytoplasma sp.]WRH06601.1 MAG: 30S ribosomal protein S6 [Phytoplasma sp.]